MLQIFHLFHKNLYFSKLQNFLHVLLYTNVNLKYFMCAINIYKENIWNFSILLYVSLMYFDETVFHTFIVTQNSYHQKLFPCFAKLCCFYSWLIFIWSSVAFQKSVMANRFLYVRILLIPNRFSINLIIYKYWNVLEI